MFNNILCEYINLVSIELSIAFVIVVLEDIEAIKNAIASNA